MTVKDGINMGRQFNFEDEIYSLYVSRDVTLQLNNGYWGDEEKVQYDFRIWEGDLPQGGFALDREDLFSLYEELKEYFDECAFAYEEYEDDMLLEYKEEDIFVEFCGFIRNENGVKAVFCFDSSPEDTRLLFVKDLNIDGEKIADYIQIAEIDSKNNEGFCYLQLNNVYFDDEEYKIEFSLELDDEDEDEICSSNVITINFCSSEKRIEVEIEEDEDTYFEDIDEYILSFESFVVYTNYFSCITDGHEPEETEAVVQVLDKRTNNLKYIKFPCFKCNKCKVHYIDLDTYNQLKQYGYILCQVLSQREFDERESGYNPFSDLNPQSLLYRCGYNVNASNNLSDNARHVILERIISSGIITKDKVIGHLRYLIKMNQYTKSFEKSREKWKKDIEYLYNHEVNVGIGKIVLSKDIIDLEKDAY